MIIGVQGEVAGCWLCHPETPGGGGNSQFHVRKVKGTVKQSKKTTSKKQEQDVAANETPARDLRDKGLDDDTADVLDEIECCLAEVEQDNRAARQAAKDEWDKNTSDYTSGLLSAVDAMYNRRVWLQKYEGLIKMKVDCCGTRVPDFEGLD